MVIQNKIHLKLNYSQKKKYKSVNTISKQVKLDGNGFKKYWDLITQVLIYSLNKLLVKLIYE